jgi:hypothetical protein
VNRAPRPSRAYVWYRYSLGCLSTSLLAAVVCGTAYWLFMGGIGAAALLPHSNPPRLLLSAFLGVVLLFTFVLRLPGDGMTMRDIKALDWSMFAAALGCLLIAFLSSGVLY